MKRQFLPDDLKLLVSRSLETLGRAVKAEYGLKTFNRVEGLRKSMKTLRRSTPEKLFNQLVKEKSKFEKMSTQDLEEIALSSTFLLELTNRCENAYRSYQLSKKEKIVFKKRPYNIIMVLTAHPTEARSPQILEIFSAIQDLLIRSLVEDQDFEDELYHLLMIGLKVSLARRKRPTVMDEAQNIYSYILSPSILERLIAFAKRDISVSLRAWVGGDKDGHPGVDQKTMLQSLNLSREIILEFIKNKLKATKKFTKLIHDQDLKKLEIKVDDCLANLSILKKIQKDDGKKIVSFKKSLNQLIELYEKELKVQSPRLDEIKKLLWIFPAIVVPLEVREDSELVALALTSKDTMAIEKMLQTLKSISHGYKAKWYVRGFILSMVESHKDIQNGLKLVKKVFKNYEIPVVPLFENEKALTNAKEILTKLLNEDKSIVKHHVDYWGSRYEVMVGYSDSSKENGVFPSRLMISNALHVIEATLKKYKITPVFFHGSGGSIERGGGSIKEQTRWWPKSAINIYKATIQGEMVSRNFGDDRVFAGQVTKITEQLNLAKSDQVKNVDTPILRTFSNHVRHEYSTVIKSEDFFEVIDSATPYSFLGHLKIGSRPTKRSTGGDSRKLRAIPWILCWTQNRVLFPTWWGTGTAWKILSSSEKKQFKDEYRNNPLVSSYINALGFTLAKVELGVFKLYLKESRLSEEKKKEVYEKFKDEYSKAVVYFQAVTGKKELLWFRPWLQESIDYRSSMIHPLNLIQLESLKRNEIDLLRDTVTGISCGMLTTG
jgi:phosphoenolpyruvate carboxylase